MCEERVRLQGEFAKATLDLVERMNRQMLAVMSGDLDFAKFDAWVSEAMQERQRLRDELLRHVQTHGCGEAD